MITPAYRALFCCNALDQAGGDIEIFEFLIVQPRRELDHRPDAAFPRNFGLKEV
jgi:hypothetical protein